MRPIDWPINLMHRAATLDELRRIWQNEIKPEHQREPEVTANRNICKIKLERARDYPNG